MNKDTRKNGQPIKVYCLPSEKNQIKEASKSAGMSASEYLRKVGLGYEIRFLIDQEGIIQLSKINADLGRLGGLLKLWLTNDEKLKHIDSNAIIFLLQQIGTTQDAMYEVVQQLLTKF